MRRFRAVTGSRVLICAVMLGVAACGSSAASAEPLDKDACAQLGAERDSLAKMGVEQNMAKGAEWASANLPASGLDLIKRFISVNEQIKFRCRAAVASAAAAAASEPAEKPKKVERKASVARALPAKAAPAKAEPSRVAPAKAAVPARTSHSPGAAAPHKPKAAGARPASANSVETINATVN